MALGDREPFPHEPAPRPASPPPPRAHWMTPVTFALIAASVGVFVFFGQRQPPSWGVLLGTAVAQGEWWRLATSLVTHGGALHLGFNMWAVWTIGRPLEGLLGSGRLLLITLVTGLGSGLAVLVVDFNQPTVGLSGAILGWVGVLLPILKREGRRQVLLWLLQVAAISLLPGVSWAGHLGGFLAGLPLGLALRRGPGAFSVAAALTAFVLGVATVVVVWSQR